MATVSERLKLLRKQNKYSQKQIGEFLGISESGYGYYEQGRNEPSIDMINKLADKYDVTADYLLGRSDDPNQNEDENFDPLEELKQFMIENNMQDMDLGFYDIEKWKQLSREDIEDVKKHFEYVLHRAQERNKENK
ncbi:helix-turn-helix domain-containing protein [Salimicrobium album]|uniref:Helix-turn-helix n=1 Tax=Salimicrobium album TaxID=50717 RepID=A0A1H3D4U2_9BACI|nr:helix-turn-helix domain-containing protein [Salimicrobium album]SDX61483.1 Helix-turn-helix [Salimicrobium album]